MKAIFNKLFIAGFITALFASCKKDEVKAVIQPGTAPVLATSATSIVLDSANGGSAVAITYSCNAVNYGVDVAATYILQIDSVNGNFNKPVNIALGASLSKSYTAAEFNPLVQSLGLVPGVAGQIISRVKVDVNKGNGSPSIVSTILSDMVNITVTPYSTKPKPKFPVPDNLYLVGDASQGGWTNPVPVPSQQFTKVDENTFGIITQLNAGKHYLFLPTNGDWGHKYAVNAPDNSNPALKDSGEFQPDAGPDIPAPDVDGWYLIIVDFVKGQYTVTPATEMVPDNLYIIGDATPGGWNNPVPVPSQQFTKTTAAGFELTLPLFGGRHYLFLPANGSWDHKYAAEDNTIPEAKTGGPFKTDSGQDIPSPDNDGTYKIEVNFITHEYKVTKQ